MNVRKAALVAGSLVIGGTMLTGCGLESATEPWNDAPVSHKNDGPAEIGSMPDGFANYAEKCDGHGFRVFTTREGSAKGGGKDIAVVADPTCK